MITFRDRMARGRSHIGWLDSRHSFSFAEYEDPAQMGFRTLRVINEDRVVPGAGFPPHRHRDMEILTYVLDGALEHKDSLGNGAVIRPGDVQRMSAGRGVQHSEFNASKSEPVHFLQIWIQPDRTGIDPGYEEKHFSAAERRGRLCLIASPDRADGSLLIHQDARVYAGLFDGAEGARLELPAGRRVYVHLARGALSANRVALSGGDALQLGDTPALQLTDAHNAEVLVFDLPG
jgi:redox-sensitive bicupin YhaK (pirin superfamily)